MYKSQKLDIENWETQTHVRIESSLLLRFLLIECSVAGRPSSEKMYKSQKFSIESAQGKTSFEQSSQLLHSQIWDSCSGALKLKPKRISIEGHNSQTQTDNQLRSISGQTVRDRAESVELFSLSKDQAEKMRYVEAKSDQYERSCACLKFNSILSRATLARFVRTLEAHSSAHSDPILVQHISFFASGPD